MNGVCLTRLLAKSLAIRDPRILGSSPPPKAPALSHLIFSLSPLPAPVPAAPSETWPLLCARALACAYAERLLASKPLQSPAKPASTAAVAQHGPLACFMHWSTLALGEGPNGRWMLSFRESKWMEI
jgi:hypothetical protein